MRSRFCSRFATAVAAAMLAGCSGGAHSVAPAPSQNAAVTTQGKAGTAKFSLAIPSMPISPTARRAQFVSASTQSGAMSVNGGTTVGFNLTAGGPNCTAVASGRACTISIPAPVGSDTFMLTVNDGPLVAGAATGSALSASVGFTATVAEGAANVTTPLVLDGIPASYQLVVSQQPLAYSTSGATSDGTAILDVYDADSNLIVGPGNYTGGNNAVTGFTVGASSTNYAVSLNGAAAVASVHVTAPSDQLTFTQTAAALGARLTVSPDIAATTATGPLAFIRPVGFSATDIESASSSPGANFTQLAPISDQTYGVGGWANNGNVGEFTTDGTATRLASCGTAFQRQPDMAVADGSVWYQALGDVNVDFATCSPAPQFGGAVFGTTDVGLGGANGILLIDVAGGLCVAQNLVPGVFENAGTGSPSNCTEPHDLVANGQGYYAVIETNSSDTHDHLVVYHNRTFTTDLPMTHASTTAAGGSLVSIGPRADDLFVEELPAARLWSVSEPNSTAPAAVSGFISMPAGYTYVNNLVLGATEFSSRTFAIGSDGLAYAAVSAPFDGVLVFDPATGGVVAQLPNTAAESGTVPTSVVSDNRGTIYWAAGSHLMHYPSSVSLN
jgi:hypothetical protein